jgi:hypothetical protein
VKSTRNIYSHKIIEISRKLLLAIVFSVAVVGGVRAASEWADSQNASGEISVTSGSADLYVCEPTGSSGDPICLGDDSGADEIIFEDDEDMAPGSLKAWDVRLVNRGDLVWDVYDVLFSITEEIDENEDCNSLPVTLGFPDAPPGFPPLTALEPYTDDHQTTGGGEFGPPFRFLPGRTTVHVAPGEYQDVRIEVIMPADLPIACRGNAWNISFTFVVEPHQ